MENEKKDKKKKIICLFLCAVLLVTGSIAGTLAYLSARTATLTNTFTYGNVVLELKETTGDTYTIIPGQNIKKDPKVTVKKGGQDSYVFVTLKKDQWPEAMTYSIADGWTSLPSGQEDIDLYYREVPKNDKSDVTLGVLGNDTINVPASVEVTEETKSPTLAVTAYAVQKDAGLTPGDAWNIAKGLEEPVQP